MDKFILDFAGSSSSGKTTVAEDVYHMLKNNGFSVCIVPSISRFLGEQNIGISDSTTVFTQAYISLMNWTEVLSKSLDYDIVLTTDFGIRSTAYLLSIDPKSKLENELFVGLVKTQFKFLELIKNLTYTSIIHFYIPVEIPLVTDGVRCEDLGYQKKTSDLMLEVYKKSNTPYVVLSGTPEERAIKVCDSLPYS